MLSFALSNTVEKISGVSHCFCAFPLPDSMENSNSVAEQEKIASFAAIVGESAEKARQFLQAANWRVEEAIDRFYAQSDDAAAPVENVRAPLPIRREALYDDDYIRDREREQRSTAEWSRSWGFWDRGNDRLEKLYSPPFGLMFKGSFEQAKIEAAGQGKWLIANIQNAKEFSSYMLNRDTWANNAVKETIAASFIFWQIIDDSEEGRKVCSYYHLTETEMPSTLVIDSITGQKMRAWQGTIHPQRLLEDLLSYIHNGPMEFSHPKQPKATSNIGIDINAAGEASASLASLDIKEEVLKTEYPALPEEPEGENICRVGVRFPDGKRVERKFLKTDPLQLLWSFCYSQVKEAADGRQFRQSHVVLGSSLGTLEYDTNLIFQDSGLSNSLISMTLQ